MSVVLLVRHGQASWGAADYDRLSATGEEQARVLGRALVARGVRPDLLVSGAMRRHRQTAAAAVSGASWVGDVVEDDGWNEFDHRQMLELHPPAVGEGEELTRAQFQKWFEEATLRWTSGAHAEEYDESFAAFGVRVDAALRRIVERLEPKQTAVVFTSGGPVSWVAAALLSAGAELWTQLNPVTVNASVTKVVVGRRGATLVSFNDHGHLEAEDPSLITYR
ncbi:MAG: histidine phosphatase family protein [Nocardioidaceae bacterium]